MSLCKEVPRAGGDDQALSGCQSGRRRGDFGDPGPGTGAGQRATGDFAVLPGRVSRRSGSAPLFSISLSCVSWPPDQLPQVSPSSRAVLIRAAQLELDMEQPAYWVQIGKGVRQGCILSPCLFHLCAEYIMRNTGLEAQAGIKIARRTINNLRYADDTTVMQKVKRN